MRVGQTLGELGRACRRVSSAYREVGQFRGDRAYVVRVTMKGLERPESDRVFRAFTNQERAERVADPVHDDELAAKKLSFVEAEVRQAASITAAMSLVLDALRAALLDVGLAERVEVLTAEAKEVAPEVAA